MGSIHIANREFFPLNPAIEDAYESADAIAVDHLVRGYFETARDLFEKMLSYRNPHGLLSEDVDPKDLELWGNFPQTYSMVGLIHSALRLSNSWENAF